jgi:hypothetical protein
MTAKPECPADADWSFDAQARLDLFANRAADPAGSLSSAEWAEMNDLEGRRKAYLAHRGAVAAWQADQQKAVSRPAERQENDGVGAKLAQFAETRRQQHHVVIKGGKTVETFIPSAERSQLGNIAAALAKGKGE